MPRVKGCLSAKCTVKARERLLQAEVNLMIKYKLRLLNKIRNLAHKMISKTMMMMVLISFDRQTNLIN